MRRSSDSPPAFRHGALGVWPKTRYLASRATTAKRNGGRMKKLGWFGAALAALAMGASAPAGAEEAAGPPLRNFVALGAGATPEYLGADSFRPIPFLAARYDAGFAVFALTGLSASVDFLGPQTGGALSAGPLARFNFGRDDVDDAAVDALPDVDPSIELGGFVAYRILGLAGRADSLSFRLDGVYDVADGHGGFIVTPSVGYSAPVTRRLRATLSVSASYGDESFSDAFFTVDAAGAAASGLDAFDAEAGFYKAGVSLSLNYALTREWGVTGVASYSRLIGDAADSSIVDDAGSANQFFFGGGIVYRF